MYTVTLQARLGAQRDHMQQLLRRWKKLPDCVPTGSSLCHLIDQAAQAAGEECRHD